MSKINRTLLYVCTFLLIAGLFLFVIFVRESKLRVAVIDGASSSRFSFNIKKTIYEKGDSETTKHSNIVWNLLIRDLDASKIDFFEYSVMKNDGQITTDTIIKALKQAQKDNIDVINFSGGFYLENEEIRKQVHTLLEKGVVIVAAGGNNYQGVADFPARMSGVISVGSKKGKKISSFSAIDKIDIYENGEEILYDGKTYSGTSFATPKVANRIIKLYFKTKNLEKTRDNILKREK